MIPSAAKDEAFSRRGSNNTRRRQPPRVEDTRDEVAGVELIRSHPIGDRDGRGDEHRVGYIAERTVEESPGRSQGTRGILLIWLGKSLRPVATTAACCCASMGSISGTGFAEDDRLVGHAGDAIAGQEIGGGDADKYLGPDRTSRRAPVRLSILVLATSQSILPPRCIRNMRSETLRTVKPSKASIAVVIATEWATSLALQLTSTTSIVGWDSATSSAVMAPRPRRRQPTAPQLQSVRWAIRRER
jgi:hypothetical protein